MLKKTIQGLCILGILCLITTDIKAERMKIKEFKHNDEKLYQIENDFYEAVFAPSQAMFPLYYKYKPTGKDVLVRKADIASSFASRDGIQLCLPCVGGVPERLPSKGYLNTAQWDTSVDKQKTKIELNSTAVIEYNDPVTIEKARLRCGVKVTGISGSSRLQTDFTLENIGENTARFMFVAHARIAPEGEYLKGDYLWTPATRCWISDFQWPALAAAGVQPHSFTTWPIAGMDYFIPKSPAERHKHFAYAFIPMNWIINGNDQTGNFVLFNASEIKIGSRVQPSPFYCILKRDGDYLIEVSVTRELAAAYWSEPEAVAVLEPGETLAFTLDMAAGSGLNQAKAKRVLAIQQDRIIVQPEKSATEYIYLGRKP